MLRVITTNLNGIRSAEEKGFFEWMIKQQADFVCVQELKAQARDLPQHMLHPEGYQGFFYHAVKKGYSGVGIYTRIKPEYCIRGLGNEEFDSEGRYIELGFPGITLVSLYLPSGSSGEERQQAKFRFMTLFFQRLRTMAQTEKPCIVCGDWNIAHQPIDLKNWKANQKNSGFLPEERAWLSQVFDELAWVDVYRRLYPEAGEDAYTWWSNRGQAWAKNVGWRLDYQVATQAVAATAMTAGVYKARRFSDHAPLTIDYDFSL